MKSKAKLFISAVLSVLILLIISFSALNYFVGRKAAQITEIRLKEENVSFDQVKAVFPFLLTKKIKIEGLRLKGKNGKLDVGDVSLTLGGISKSGIPERLRIEWENKKLPISALASALFSAFPERFESAVSVERWLRENGCPQELTVKALFEYELFPNGVFEIRELSFSIEKIARLRLRATFLNASRLVELLLTGKKRNSMEHFAAFLRASFKDLSAEAFFEPLGKALFERLGLRKIKLWKREVFLRNIRLLRIKLTAKTPIPLIYLTMPSGVSPKDLEVSVEAR